LSAVTFSKRNRLLGFSLWNAMQDESEIPERRVSQHINKPNKAFPRKNGGCVNCGFSFCFCLVSGFEVTTPAPGLLPYKILIQRKNFKIPHGSLVIYYFKVQRKTWGVLCTAQLPLDLTNQSESEVDITINTSVISSEKVQQLKMRVNVMMHFCE